MEMKSVLESEPLDPVFGGTAEPLHNRSLKDAALAFVRALAVADTETLKAINRGVNMGFPTGYLLSRFSAQYTNRSTADLIFDVNEEENRVAVSHPDGEVLSAIRFKKLGDCYFFSHFDCY